MTSQQLSKAHLMSYRIGRGEQGVLTFEPYKSEILPLWRFKTHAIAQTSSQKIYNKFMEYDKKGDFVGMDMCRKFLQMVSHVRNCGPRVRGWLGFSCCGTVLLLLDGFLLLTNNKGMTRAKRYANHAGGRKYDKETGRELEKSSKHEGAGEKLEASLIFRNVWEKAKEYDGYVAKKEKFLKEQKEWDKQRKKEAK
jgi:hypothetical protein